jgi:hypothetical protein
LIVRQQIDEQQTSVCTVNKRLTDYKNRLGSRFPFYYFRKMSKCRVHVSMFPYLYVSGIQQTKKGTDGKQLLSFVCCKWKTETANIRLFAANENGSLFSLLREKLR